MASVLPGNALVQDEIADLKGVRTGVGFRGSLSYTVTDLRILTG
ncbi:hypothetical protein ABT294_03710 [Nonomuraea sp. NPDC000554]